ncbi:double zinc ribbon domain-containing protein [Rubrobacter calidifluminis]|uniref:double zinc ribbon domain-containing protein n=1 Tax=Rubrobacter calidifluminis TaxID=1392640 RepID=UPI00235FABBD|nr:zinc ribbon domain-containing protein [Rubrobacter calidifluminis]
MMALAQTDPFRAISNFLSSPALKMAGEIILLFIVVVWLALVYWTYADASRRGALRLVWLVVAIVFPFVGTLVYLIVRPPEYVLDSRERELELAVLERELRSRVLLCPNCQAMVERDYLVCPECSWQLKKPCMRCERPLDLDWKICPYCGVNQNSGKIEY